MNKEIRTAASRMLARANALGLANKVGAILVVDQMEELLAAAHGYRNVHAYKAALAKESAAVVAGQPQQVDLALTAEQDCWLTLGAFVVHPKLTDEGLVVDVYAKGVDDETVASTWVMQSDAEEALASQEGIDFDDVEEALVQATGRSFNQASLPERWTALEQLVVQRKEAARLTTLLSQWREALDSLGYEFTQTSGPAHQWFWSAPTDESEERFETEDEAVAAAWRDACNQAMSAHQLAPAVWDALAFIDQQRMMMALFD